MITQYIIAQVITSTTGFYRFFIHKLSTFYLKYQKSSNHTTSGANNLDRKSVTGGASLLYMGNH